MGTSLQRTMALIPQGSLEGYIQAVNSIPVLSAEEERELAMRLQQGGDLEAARQLVMSHLRFVVHVAKSYSGYGLPQADLVQEGNIGLMKAVKRFDPSVGVRLVSFAVHWIKAEIHEYVLRNWRMVKVATTKAQRKLFFNLRSMKQGFKADAAAADAATHRDTLSDSEIDKMVRDAEANAFREAVTALPEVISAFLVSGESDFLLQVVVPQQKYWL